MKKEETRVTIKIKSSLAVILTLVMIFSLAACGGDKSGGSTDEGSADTRAVKLSDTGGQNSGPGEAGSYKLYEMTFEGELFDNAFLESAGMDTAYTLDLAADGTGVLKLNEDESPVTWKDGKITVTASGAFYTYELKDGMITLTETTGDIMVFQKTDAAGGSVLDKIDENQGDAAKAASTDYWSGDWYGWWHISSADGYWENLQDTWYDCCAQITRYDETSGYIVIWDEDGSGNNEYMAECSVSFGAGTTGNGCMMSESGAFWLNDPIEHADWIVDPGASVVSQYDHMICIDGTYEDPENGGGFDYKFYLRPWGMDWEDVAAEHSDLLPCTYESWYLPAVEAGIEMPDKIGSGDFSASGEVPDSEMEGQSGEYSDPNASAVDGTWQEPVYGDYGLSKASAAGLVPLEELTDVAGYYADSQINSAWYEALYNSFDYVHGKPLVNDPRWETGRTHLYQWSAESGEYAAFVFEVDNYDAGIEILRSVETSPGLLDG